MASCTISIQNKGQMTAQPNRGGSTSSQALWCDIVAMDECHLLLGRSRQYAKVTINDEKQNIYDFI